MAYVGIAFCLLITLLAVFVRVYFRVTTRKKPSIEEFLALAAIGPYATFAYYICYVTSKKESSAHLAYISYEDYILVLEFTSRNMMLYDATMMIIKASILLDWARLFAPRRVRNAAFFWTCHAMLGFNVVYYIIAIAIESRSCLRHMRDLDPCIDTHIRDICSASIHVLSDLLILLLPQKIIWSLSISLRKKAVISLVFATGILACACAAVRLALLDQFYKINVKTRQEFLDLIDNYYLRIPLWCLAEMTCTFVVFSAPAAPQVLHKSGIGPKFSVIFKYLYAILSKSHRRKTSRSCSSAIPRSPDLRYRMVDEVETTLQTPPRARITAAPSHEPVHATQLPVDAILRTTHIETSVDNVDSNKYRGLGHHENPWDDHV